MKKGGIRKYLPVVLEKLKDGLEPKELDKRFRDNRDKSGIPHDTLYEIIKILENSGVIYREEDGKYYFIWRKEIQEFKTKGEYEAKLRHSEQFLKKTLEKDKIKYWERLISDENFIQHLKTGYPEIYELYMEFRQFEKAIKNEENICKKLIEEELRKFNFEVVKNIDEAKGKRINYTIYNLLKVYFDRLLKLGYSISISADPSGIVKDVTSGYGLSCDESMAREIEKIVNELLKSEKLRDAYNKLRELELRKINVYYNLKSKIEFLMEKIKHGEPLRGYCGLCPHVKIRGD